MSLEKCTECGHPISSEAEVCPHCGMKTARGKQESEKKVQFNARIVAIVIDIIGAVIILLGFMTMMEDISNYHDVWASGYNYKAPLTEHEIAVIAQMVFGLAVSTASSIWYNHLKNSK